ncbi:M67 family metallopeptidase [Sphingobium sp. B7D2B]|uniref:M67 family metallopeptidase n=1 Tax=Sphingobium sp. B7D2B TaxID=2940583 RepID=UPI002225120D|nr:M67 family metallopeptidase [Sphingobium sp. B7D2B]
MAVHISRPLRDAIRAQAKAAASRECCGLLLGQRLAGADGGTTDIAVTELRAAANVAEQPEHRFEVDPAVLIAAHREARQGGPAIVGHYHSHPHGEAVPSAVDAAMAGAAGEIWLLVGERGGLLAWQVVASGRIHGVFDPVELVGSPHGRLAPARPQRHEGTAIA